MDVFVSFIMMPLNAIEDRKYHAQRKRAFSLGHTPVGSAACAAVQVNWKKFPGIISSEIGDSATVCENSCGRTR